MNFICLDDEPLALKRLTNRLSIVMPKSTIYSYQFVEDVFKGIEENKIVPDVVFSDIEMLETNGIEFSKRIKALFPNCKIILVTGYSQYAIDAYKNHFEGYILKPVTEEAILSNLKFLFPNLGSELYARCFGNFDLFYNGEPISFSRKKAKEFLALLIDRAGGTITTKEAITILFNKYDRTTQVMFQQINAVLRKTFEDLGIKDLIINNHTNYSINMEKVKSDYFDFIKTHKKNEIDSYMTQYSWAKIEK